MKTSWQRLVVLLGAVAIALVFGRYLNQFGYLDPAYVKAMSAASPLASAGIFLATYAVCTVLVIPTLPLNVAAGFLWGGLGGGLLSALGATLGACAAFAVVRIGVGRNWASRTASLASRLAREVDRLGWRAVAFVRLNPAIPSSLANYAFGTTALRFRTYAWASLVFFTPICVVIAIIGEQTGTLVAGSAEMDLIRAALVAFAAGTVVVAVPWVLRLARARID